MMPKKTACICIKVRVQDVKATLASCLPYYGNITPPCNNQYENELISHAKFFFADFFIFTSPALNIGSATAPLVADASRAASP